MTSDWRLKDRSAKGPYSAAGFSLWGWALFFLAFLALQIWLLPVLTDWVSSAVDEGYTAFAARRIQEGAWPHRDFFFLWTPGTAYLHAFLQAIGCDWLWERGVALAASTGSFCLILKRALTWFDRRGDRWLLSAMLTGWSFSLWNIPYSSWYAVFLALLAIEILPRSEIWAGFLFGLAFWFKQNIGILAFAGSLSFLFLVVRERKAAWKLAWAFLLVMTTPFFLLYLGGGPKAFAQAFSQIFLFPLRYPSLMGTMIRKEVWASPLTTLGFWLLSLFFLRREIGSRSARLVQLGVLFYALIYFLKAPGDFSVGFFSLLSILAWPAALVLALALGAQEERVRFLSFWLPAAGIFLQVFPRLDFQHLLFVFPLSAFFLQLALAGIRERYSWLPPMWAQLPSVFLAVAGLLFLRSVIHTRLNGNVDPLGRISAGIGFRLNTEVWEVKKFLESQGMKEGDPLLVLPNATAMYVWTGFRNPTNHPQFFPGYVEAFGDRQENVLRDYRTAGGRFLLIQERSGLERNVPVLFREIELEYFPLRRFPEHFTVYAPKALKPQEPLASPPKK